jgi:midasin (ATPase involved in ribosome maturation)
MNELDPVWKIAQKTQDPEIDDFTPNELILELEYHLRNPESGRPLLIWGAPGIGKTSIIKSFGLENKGIPVIEIILSLMEPTDVAGLPGIEQDEKDNKIKRRWFTFNLLLSKINK